MEACSFLDQHAVNTLTWLNATTENVLWYHRDSDLILQPTDARSDRVLENLVALADGMRHAQFQPGTLIGGKETAPSAFT